MRAGPARTLGGMADEPQPDERGETPPIHGGDTATFSSHVFEGDTALAAKEALALRKVEGLSRRGHRVLDLGRLEQADRGLIVDRDSLELWRRSVGEPGEGRPLEHAVGVTDSFELAWYEPAVKADGSRLTVDEVLEADRQAEELTKQAQAEAERVRRERRKQPPARVITFADLHPQLGQGPMTLRQAVERLEALGAVVAVADGRVFVHATPGDSVNRLAALICAAEPVVVAAVKSGPVDPARLPDVEVSPSGAPLSEKMVGRGLWS